MRLIDTCSDALVPGLTRRLLLAVLATLAPAVAASPAGAAGHSTHAPVKARPNVGIVNIYTTLGYEQGRAAGTGMIISRSGEVLTNNHVIRGATKFKVVDVTTHRKYSATVVGYSVSRDIAVLRGGPPKTARGRIIALHQQIFAEDESGDSETLNNVIATNAPVVPGYSGGPLENSQNRVLGIVTAGSTSGVHRGFAIPLKQALQIVRRIESGKSNAIVHVGPTAFLGVVLADAPGGAKITSLLPGKPADEAGLAKGDVITSLDGATISSSADVRQAVLMLVPGKAVPIGWKDTNGIAQTGTITPISGPPQ
jgi:S1-C subfamily serine protease